jgi:hypothetical protein
VEIDWRRVEFQWDEWNLGHAARHGVTPELVLAVANGEPVVFENEGDGRSGSHVMIGSDEAGRFWTVIVLELTSEIWRPITGWPSTPSEIRLHKRKME